MFHPVDGYCLSFSLERFVALMGGKKAIGPDAEGVG
jgi:hypothetical protein